MVAAAATGGIASRPSKHNSGRNRSQFNEAGSCKDGRLAALGAGHGGYILRSALPARIRIAIILCMTSRAELRTANAQNQYTVTPRDLPLACPMPDMTLWNSHPRVYLPIEATGFAKCPYCGAEYTLQR